MADTKVNWPQGYSDFYYKIKLHADKICTGTLVSVDPASGGSSLPGFALFHAGVLQTSGTIALNKKAPIQERLATIYEKVQAISPVTPDVFVIELLRGRMVHWMLHWASGAAIAASGAPVLLECPISVWKALAKTDPTYEKDDAKDAEMLGRAVIQLANEAPRVDTSALPKPSKPKAPAGRGPKGT